MKMIERAGLHLLHRLDPERAHDLSLRALRMGIVPLPRAPFTSDRLRLRLAGMELPNPVGLAAGYDKNAIAIAPLRRAGFGFIEVGAATPRPQSGNDKPRLFRLTADGAIINRFGFNNDGVAVIAQRLAARVHGIVPVGLNVGANKDSTDRAADYVEVVRQAGGAVDFVTVNVSSPNTGRLRDLQQPEALVALLAQVNEARRDLVNRPALFLKIAPDLDDPSVRDIAAVAAEAGIDGIIATNTTVARNGLKDPQASETGGLSGAPLFDRSTRVLAQLYRETNGKMPLIGVGGIANVDQAWAKLCAGASAVQVYSALIYHGFSLATKIAQGLDARLKSTRMSLEEIRGSGADELV
ncbi:quinone-dependent dihydroorotate dehydrogenase [Paracoccus sp. TK19116]|uniref:Dihydroorotate dehydrogenase (quinone) n=1 Tax=Paracoccus albicereus TaxID=2922394 RepID=A0ABT1MU71_9RHOB|nr:quinone-dependent dihydroorotate dehydrogenase [Paracoccus albicereus]MCQ0971873.1 quinone-dependent dihydroorotate dehydrogenase [Paracoccus albicereus]